MKWKVDEKKFVKTLGIKHQTNFKMVMRIRKTNAILGTALIIGVLMMIYLVIDTISYEDLDAQKEELNSLEIKLRSLENDLLVNQKTIDLIKGQEISKAKL